MNGRNTTNGEMMSIPTRIVKEPEKILKGNGKYGLLITCDDGVTYDLVELAVIIGLSKDGLYKRLRSHGWDYEMIISRKAVPGETIDKQRYLRTIKEAGNNEWLTMSTRPRTERLSGIVAPGTFERRMGA